MNDPHKSPEDQNDSSSTEMERLRDHLADFALREVCANESPPDLSESILALANRSEERKVETKSNANKSILGVALAIAVCLGLLASPWLMTQFGGSQSESETISIPDVWNAPVI